MTESEEKIPCHECICFAACKNKLFLDLMLECKQIADFTGFFGGHDKTYEVYEQLQPTRWKPFPEPVIDL